MNRYTETQIQESLEKFHAPQLSEDILNIAEAKVWSKVSSSILTTPTMSESSNSKVSVWTNFLSNRRILLAVSTVILILVISAVVIRFAPTDSKNQSNIDKPLTIAELREKANQKLTTLSGGVTLETLQSTVNTIDKSSGSNYPISASNDQLETAPVPTQNKTVKFVDPEAAFEIIQKEQIKDSAIFYMETEFISGENSSPYFKNDTHKPIIYKNWFSLNYSKNISYIDGKVDNFYLNTPEFSLIYLGGKYALKEIYSSPNYFTSFDLGATADASWSPRNGEIEFLKFLLDPTNNMIDDGMQVVDGKNLRVIEDKYKVDDLAYTQEPISNPAVPSDSVSSEVVQDKKYTGSKSTEFSTKYYIDQNEMTIYLTESYIDGKLNYSNKNLVSKSYENEPLDNFFHYKELDGVEIKENIIRYPSAEELSTVSFITKYDFYYFPEISLDLAWVSDQSLWTNYETNNYYDDPDFNPEVLLFDTGFDTSSEYITPVANYAQFEIITEIYDQEPDYKQWIYEGVKETNQKNIQVNLSGTTVNGKYKEIQMPEYTYTDEFGNEVKNTYIAGFIEFKSGKYWYVVNFTPGKVNPVSASDTITLAKLSPEQAKQIDDKNTNIINQPFPEPAPDPSTVPSSQVLPLNKVSEDLLLLPGDLSQKYNLVAFTATVTEVPAVYQGDFDDCFVYECLQYHYRSLNINFASNINQSESLTYLVFGANMDSLNFDKLRKIATAYIQDVSEKDLPEVKTLLNGIKVVQKKDSKTKYVFVPYKDYTILIVTELEEDKYLDIAKNIGPKKDLDILQAQIDSWNSVVSNG